MHDREAASLWAVHLLRLAALFDRGFVGRSFTPVELDSLRRDKHFELKTQIPSLILDARIHPFCRKVIKCRHPDQSAETMLPHCQTGESIAATQKQIRQESARVAHIAAD